MWMASRTGSLPRKLNDTLDTPPPTLAPGRFCLIQRVASMKVDRVVVLFNAGGHGANVGVEMMSSGETRFVHQDAVRAFANLDLARRRCRRAALLVKRHHHGRGAMAP